MSDPEQSSQEVLTPSPPGLDQDHQDHLNHLSCLLRTARTLRIITVPEAVQDWVTMAADASREGKPAPSMAPVKREIVRFREEVAWMLRQAGTAQARIAFELGISQSAVSRILRRVERRVLARMEAGVRAVKAKQAAQLEYIVDQAMVGWNRSKGQATEERVTREFDRDEYRGVAGRSRSTTCTRSRDSPGDPRFLVVALQALAAERELWCLDAVAGNRHHHDETAPPPIGPHNGHALVLTGPRVSLNGRVPEGESTCNGTA
jgi:hypothetical protein